MICLGRKPGRTLPNGKTGGAWSSDALRPFFVPAKKMIGLIQKVIDKFSRKGAGVLESANDPFTIWASSKRISPAKAMAVYNGWVYACIRAIAEEIANMQWRLFSLKGEDATELFDHEVLDLLNGVNEFQTGYELKYTIAAHLESVGNFYGYLEGVSSETDKPKAIHPLAPDRMRPVVGKSTFPNRIVKYLYTDNGGIREFQPYEILHLKYPDPNDPNEGIGTVQSIGLWIDADTYAMEFNKRFFMHGARIGGIILSDNARTKPQLEHIKASFEAAHKGYDSAYKTLILPKGTKYEQASESQKDMDFANLMLMMRDRILAGFRVPRTVLGITDDVNRANAEATNYIFALRTIKPKMQLIVAYLNEFLVPRYGENLYLDFEDPVPENTELKIQEMRATTGVLSPNEMRERYFGYDPIQNGDEVMVAFNLVPLGAPTPKAAKGRKSQNGSRPSVRYAKAAKKRRELGREFAEKTVALMKFWEAQQAAIAKKALRDLTDDDYKIVYAGFEKRVVTYIKLVAEAMRKLNRGQRDRVLNNLADAVKAMTSIKKGVSQHDLFDLREEMGITIDLVSPSLTDLYQTESNEASKLLGTVPIDIVANLEMRQALTHAIELMSRSYNETTLDLLKAKLDQGIASGAGVFELRDIVREVYAFSDENRAEMVARTESFRIANDSTKRTWQASGVVRTIRWYAANDELTCDACAAMNGKVIDINDNFFDKGDPVPGLPKPVEYDDVGAPPLHPDCRCYTRPEDLVEP